MKPLLIAYAGNKGIRMMTQEDARRLTHINLAFGVIEDGLLSLKHLDIWEDLPTIRQWNPDIKFVLSIGGWGAGGFSEMAGTPEGRRAFAKSCRDAMDKHNLDGIDMDWEHSCDSTHTLLAAMAEELGR